MSPSVPPNVPQHEQEQQQQHEPADPMIRRMMMLINDNTPMQHPPVQRVDNFQDLQSQSLFNLEHARGHCAGSSQASALPTSFNQSAAMYPTLTSNGISMCPIGQSAATPTNPAASLPLSGNFNHGVGQLPVDQLTNELNQGASREFEAMHPNAHTNQNPQLVARIRARRQMQLQGRDRVIQNLRMLIQEQNQYVQKQNQYVQLLENLVAESMSQQDSTSE